MHKQANHGRETNLEHASDLKAREAQRPAKKAASDIHPSLRALPDYPE